METFLLEELEIRYAEEGDTVKMEWHGLSTLHDPGYSLDPHLDTVITNISGKTILIDFRPIQFMNSSSFVSICTFIKKLNEHKIHTRVFYDTGRDWQRFSFSVLEELSENFQYIQFKG